MRVSNHANVRVSEHAPLFVLPAVQLTQDTQDALARAFSRVSGTAACAVPGGYTTHKGNTPLLGAAHTAAMSLLQQTRLTDVARTQDASDDDSDGDDESEGWDTDETGTDITHESDTEGEAGVASSASKNGSEAKKKQ